MSDYTDDTLSEAREWLAGPKASHDPNTTGLVERLQNELRRSDNKVQVRDNALEAVFSVMSDAEGLGKPLERLDIRHAVFKHMPPKTPW